MCSLQSTSPLTQVIFFDELLASDVSTLIDKVLELRVPSLCAQRVGSNKNIIIVNGDDDVPYALVNPRLAWASPEKTNDIEWCSDHPGKAFNVQRSSTIEVEYQDVSGATFHTFYTDKLARAILHEFDHMNGISVAGGQITSAAAMG